MPDSLPGDAPPNEPGGAVSSSPSVPAAASPPVALQLVRLVEQLQDDLSVLIRHVVSRAADKPSTIASLLNGPGARAIEQVGQSGPEYYAGLLVLTPEAIARDRALLEQLYGAVEGMTRLAAPADVRSVRLTRAFVQGQDDAGSSLIIWEVKRLQHWAWMSAVFGLLVFLGTVVLLVHVDSGRRTVQQLEQVRTAYRTVTNDFDVARAAAAGAPGQSGLTECESEAAASPLPSAPSRIGEQEPAMCGQLRDVLIRMSIVHRELRIWNTISDRLSYASPITWLSRRLAPVAGLSEEQWDSTELRTGIMITALTGFVLPMLLGLLGACVYVYREIDSQVQTSTLQAGSWVHGALRMILGAILGGLLGAVWTNGQTIQLEGVSLSLGALAFFVGFSVEVVFRLVNTLVRTVADRISKPDT